VVILFFRAVIFLVICGLVAAEIILPQDVI